MVLATIKSYVLTRSRSSWLSHLVLLHLLSLAAPLALIIREITVIAVRHLDVLFYPYNPDGNTTEQTTSNTRKHYKQMQVYMLLD